MNSSSKIMLGALVFGVLCTRLAAQQAEPAPLPEPYIETLGNVRGLELLPCDAEGVGGIDFCFHFKPDGVDDELFVISRGSTPFEEYRLGPTYVCVDQRSLADGARIRLVGVKMVDRIPATFHKKPLPPEGTITLLAITQAGEKPESTGTPLYINNWFHPWRKDKDGTLLDGIMDRRAARHYVDRKDPFWVCGWLPADTSSPDRAKRLVEVRHLLEEADLRVIAAEPFKKGCLSRLPGQRPIATARLPVEADSILAARASNRQVPVDHRRRKGTGAAAVKRVVVEKLAIKQGIRTATRVLRMNHRPATWLMFAFCCIVISATAANVRGQTKKPSPAYVELTGRAEAVRVYQKADWTLARANRWKC